MMQYSESLLGLLPILEKLFSGNEEIKSYLHVTLGTLGRGFLFELQDRLRFSQNFFPVLEEFFPRQNDRIPWFLKWKWWLCVTFPSTLRKRGVFFSGWSTKKFTVVDLKIIDLMISVSGRFSGNAVNRKMKKQQTSSDCFFKWTIPIKIQHN